MDSCQDTDEEKDMDIFTEQLKTCDEMLTDTLENDQESHQTEENNSTPDPKCSTAQGSSKSQSFQIAKESIPCVPKEDQEQELMNLGVSVYDQTQFENEVMDQVDKALKQQEEAKRVADAEKELHVVNEDIRFVKQRLNHIEKALSLAPKDPNQMTNSGKRELSAIKREQDNKLKHLKKLEAKHKALRICISGSAEEVNTFQSNIEENEEMDEETLYHLKQVFAAKETEEERLIRTGEMTPFGTVVNNKQKEKPKPRNISIPQDQMTDFDKFLLTEAENHESEKAKKASHHPKPSTSKAAMKEDLGNIDPGFTTFTDLKAVSRKKIPLPKVKLGSKHAKGYSKKSNPDRSLVKNYKSDPEMSDFEKDDDEDEMQIHDDVRNYSSDDVYIPDGRGSDEDDDYGYRKKGKKAVSKRKQKSTKRDRDVSSDSSDSDYDKRPKGKMSKIIDDGNQEAYIKRLQAYEKEQLVKKHQKILESDDGIIESDDDFTEFDEYKIPNSVWNKLYKYQQTCVRWLWELHQQNCGGIMGDEMGLGKTIQLIAFLVGLKVSKLLTDGDSIRGLGPVILVCPATVMHQWVREFHTWWPPFRAAVLHESGSFSGKKSTLIHNVNRSNGVLITSYNGIVQHQDILLKYEWHYIVLDEGHKIRNPDAQATLAVKQFRTPHRVILSGSPVQNNLKELWSLFDFIFPGKLGTLPVFMQQFSVPIVLGGYANASQVQVQTAYKCATVLRDTIKPYLLRRMKSDVKMNINLPDKSEQVLFCQLTEEQVNLYKGYINSKEVGSILNARLQVFVGLINLRKICNHPDIFDGGPKIFKDTDVDQLSEEEKYGYYKRSGKMIVVKSLLRLWHSQKHRVLLFTQSRQMMEILEIFARKEGYTYMKMDGSTPISSRQPLINKFNSDANIFVFLLTTRVGGLGVNLTGASRVILYDPDWNPSTDAQARERAWRIGQNKQVTIYRLLTAGTIEEKIYHRQIFKQFVTNRVLKDPRQRRFFKSNDLYELFTYNEVGSQGTETSAIFAGTGSEIDLKKKSMKQHKNPRDQAVPPKDLSVLFSEEKRKQMKLLAKKLSMQLLKKTPSESKESAEKKSEEVKPASVSEAPKTPKSCEKAKSSEKLSHSKNKESPRKSRKRKAARIDGEKIDFVVKKSVFKPPETDEEKNLKQDDYVLSKLFKKSGVHAALKHDAIVDASAADYMIVEGEANRVAKEAIKALKDSRRQCARAQEGIPTWTGQHGGIKRKFGPKKRSSDVGESSKSSPDSKSIFSGQLDQKPVSSSSSDLLSAIRKRKKVFGISENGHHSSEDEAVAANSSIAKSPTEQDELLVDIRNYIAFQAAVDGQASTKELVEAFKEKLPVNQTAVFKAMLSKICDFSRSSSGDGFWYLKEEFR